MPINFASPFRATGLGIRWPGINETQRFLLLSILIGIFAGLLVVCFHVAIEFISWISVETTSGAGVVRTILSPAIGALIAVLLIAKVFNAAKGSGVNDTKAAVYISDGHVPFSAVAGKFLTCAISIGTGNSLGPEDPSLHMGAGVASLLGRVFCLTRERTRLIAPVGAAAGLAAAFNTPIAAVLFVIEEVVAGWSAAVLGSIVLSAVSAAVVVRWFLDNQPLFLVPEFTLTSSSELLVYALVGLIGGLLSVVFVKAIERLRSRLERLPRNLAYLRPVCAGLAVGVAGIWLPEVMGAGYGAIDSALHNRFPWDALIILALVKMAVTLLCFSAGTPGGMFAPALFTGAMIGGGIGGLAAAYGPFPTSAPSAYVLVGMGTFFAGVFRRADDLDLHGLRGQRELRYRPARDDCEHHRLPCLPSTPAHSVLHHDCKARRAGTAVARRAAGATSLPCRGCNVAGPAPPHPRRNGSRCARTCEGGRVRHRKLREMFVLRSLPRLFPDLPIEAALRLLDSHPVLPVSSRVSPYKVLGVLTLRDVYRLYEIEEPS